LDNNSIQSSVLFFLFFFHDTPTMLGVFALALSVAARSVACGHVIDAVDFSPQALGMHVRPSVEDANTLIGINLRTVLRAFDDS
jgi:hypothetical protein